MDGPVTSEDYIVSEDTKYVFQEKIGLSLSSDSGKVYDESGEEEVFKIKGMHITIRDTVWLKTADDDENKIIGMKKALVSLHDSRNLVDPDDNVVAVIKKKRMMQLKAKTEVWLGDNDDGDATFEIEGGIRAVNLTVTHMPSDTVCCEVHRKQMTLKNMLTDQDTYEIEVKEGWDAAFLIMLIVTIDEMFNDENQSD